MFDDLPPQLRPSFTSVGTLRRVDPNGPTPSVAGLGAFLGTAFCFGDPHAFLTAAHCVAGELPHLLVITGTFCGKTSACFVEDVIKHPTADIAVLRTYPGEHCDALPFGTLGRIDFAGDDFWAFGYPTDVFGNEPGEPTPRIFRGHVQRFIEYRSHLGYEYYAAELSIACPPGLSGGPVFRTEPEIKPCALVTENLETVSFLHSEEEEESGGVRRVERFQTVINYGVAIDLSSVADWLTEHTGPRPST